MFSFFYTFIIFYEFHFSPQAESLSSSCLKDSHLQVNVYSILIGCSETISLFIKSYSCNSLSLDDKVLELIHTNDLFKDEKYLSHFQSW